MDAVQRTVITTGDSALGSIAGILGVAALVLSIAAIPFTGGTSAAGTIGAVVGHLVMHVLSSSGEVEAK